MPISQASIRCAWQLRGILIKPRSPTHLLALPGVEHKSLWSGLSWVKIIYDKYYWLGGRDINGPSVLNSAENPPEGEVCVLNHFFLSKLIIPVSQGKGNVALTDLD